MEPTGDQATLAPSQADSLRDASALAIQRWNNTAAQSSNEQVATDYEFLLSSILASVDKNQDAEALIPLLLELVRLGEDQTGLRNDYLLATVTAIREKDWKLLSRQFLNQEFVGPEGKFLLIGPYTIYRQGKRFTRLTVVCGEILRDKLELSDMGLFEELATVPKPPVILAAWPMRGAGLAGKEAGEAFLVPDGWSEFVDSEHGPAINDMEEQRRRLLEAGQYCIANIFEPQSANFLLAPMVSEAGIYVQNKEYLAHELGHATGIPLQQKLKLGLLTSPWYRAVEEWRSDGVEFELLARGASKELAGHIVASNLCLRLGVDAQRAGGVERDTDVNAALLSFSRLLETGILRINRDRRLEIIDQSYESLIEATAIHRMEAIRLTRGELRLTHPEGIWSLYGSVSLSQISRIVFRGHVTEPNVGIYKELM